MRKRQLGLMLVISFLFTPICRAQLIRGFVSGTVTDSGGALVPAVQITLMNVSTNVARTTETSISGSYRFVAVDPGEYSIEFRLPGFETRRVANVNVTTAQELVLDQTLTVGEVVTEVSVIETPGVALNKKTATVEPTFSERVTMELPLQVYSGVRDISRLALLAPGVTRAPSFT